MMKKKWRVSLEGKLFDKECTHYSLNFPPVPTIPHKTKTRQRKFPPLGGTASGENWGTQIVEAPVF
jgi:hypothetical protein